MDTIAKDLEELKVRFDTAPKLYEKKDFQKLLHIIEHLSEGGIEKPDEPEEPAPSPVPEVKDHKQYKGDTSRAIAKIKKRKKIKFTEDGFAIADKAIGQKIAVHNNEKIYINIPYWMQTNKWPLEYNQDDEIRYYSHIIEIVNGEIRDYGKFNNVYVHHKRTRYIDGERQKRIIEKETPTFYRIGYLCTDITSAKIKNSKDTQETKCQSLLYNAFQSLGLVNEKGVINYGVRLYTKHTQEADSKSQRRESIARSKRMKYYQYGTHNPSTAPEDIDNLSRWCRGYTLKKRHLISSFYQYLLHRKLNGRRNHSGPYYIDVIADRYIFNKGITIRYKFRIYRIYGNKKSYLYLD